MTANDCSKLIGDATFEIHSAGSGQSCARRENTLSKINTPAKEVSNRGSKKFNPCVPNGIVNSGMFVGRLEEIRVAEQALFQAKNGNPQHFIFSGERGIGKSSLAFYIDLFANGKIPFAAREKYNFLTISIDLSGIDSSIGMVRQIGREFKRKISERGDVNDRAKKVWDFLSSWEILGVRYHDKMNEMNSDDAREDLVSAFIEFLNRYAGEIDGILLMIDEADSPSVTAGLGEFMKMFTERLTKRGCGNVLIGLAGLPTLIAKLRASHESSPRVFQVMNMSALEDHERTSVIEIGIEAANEKNSVAVSITKDAVNLIADLSEGYPHFLQQFSYSAFDVSEDDVIDVDDVKKGAYMENGALSQLGAKFFSEMYYAKISSPDYRRVLDFMAQHGDGWVARKAIVLGCDVLESNINNALTALRQREIIVQDDTRRGFYRLPTKSFAAWISAIGQGDAGSGDQVDFEF